MVSSLFTNLSFMGFWIILAHISICSEILSSVITSICDDETFGKCQVAKKRLTVLSTGTENMCKIFVNCDDDTKIIRLVVQGSVIYAQIYGMQIHLPYIK